MECMNWLYLVDAYPAEKGRLKRVDEALFFNLYKNSDIKFLLIFLKINCCNLRSYSSCK